MKDEFLKLIAIHHPVAVIAVTYFGILMGSPKNVWWLKGWAERILVRTTKMLEPMPALKPWLDWPASQIHVSQ